jgi:hypothetical protein
MRRLKITAISLVWVAILLTSLSASSDATPRPKRKGYAPCCKMRHCCYKNMSCCKKKDHACCSGKHVAGGCCCKKGTCPMPDM